MIPIEGSTVFPIITFVAIATMSKSRVFDTKGNDLETLKLHSITFNSLSCKNIKNK